MTIYGNAVAVQADGKIVVAGRFLGAVMTLPWRATTPTARWTPASMATAS